MLAALLVPVVGVVPGHGMITFPPSRVGGTLEQAAWRGDMDQPTFFNARYVSRLDDSVAGLGHLYADTDGWCQRGWRQPCVGIKHVDI